MAILKTSNLIYVLAFGILAGCSNGDSSVSVVNNPGRVPDQSAVASHPPRMKDFSKKVEVQLNPTAGPAAQPGSKVH